MTTRNLFKSADPIVKETVVELLPQDARMAMADAGADTAR